MWAAKGYTTFVLQHIQIQNNSKLLKTKTENACSNHHQLKLKLTLKSAKRPLAAKYKYAKHNMTGEAAAAEAPSPRPLH